MERIYYEQLTNGMIISINNRTYLVCNITEEDFHQNQVPSGFRTNVFYGLSGVKTDHETRDVREYNIMYSLDTEYIQDQEIFIVAKELDWNLHYQMLK